MLNPYMCKTQFQLSACKLCDLQQTYISICNDPKPTPRIIQLGIMIEEILQSKNAIPYL